MEVTKTMNNAMFTIAPHFIFAIFIIILLLIVITIIKGINTWSHNNAEPKLTVSAKVVSKREDVSTYVHNDGDNFYHNSTNTNYFITFEVESGDRMEFHVNGDEYGLLSEQDKGNLTFQGTRYLGFDRNIF